MTRATIGRQIAAVERALETVPTRALTPNQTAEEQQLLHDAIATLIEVQLKRDGFAVKSRER